MREKFIGYMEEVDREGIDKLLDWLDESGFYDAPASSRYHLNVKGGLVEHSVNVIEVALGMNESLEDPLPRDSVIVASALHDLGKHKFYDKDYYVDNILKSGKVSETNPYTRNKDLVNIPHEIISIQMASRFIELTEEETWAILQHNGMYGDLKYALRGNETPLQILVHSADMWSSKVIES